MFILHYDDHGVDKTHELRPGVTLIGRLPTSDLVIADASVSRHHASLRTTDGQVLRAGRGQPLRHVRQRRARRRTRVELTPGAR